MAYLVLDLATTPIDNAISFIAEPSAPANYKDAEKIAAYVRERRAELEQSAALDIDLARISAIGWWSEGYTEPIVELCQDERQERWALTEVSRMILDNATLIGFNSLKYDWPLLMRRCLYLGLRMPSINLDRYRSPHHDLWNQLSFNGAVTAHALQWYVKRLGWTDLSKPLTGAEEANAPAAGRWAELEASVRCDVTATLRLAQWMRIIP